MNIEDSPFQFLDNTPKIRVIIRKRPLGKKELQRNDQDIIDCKGPQTLAVREMKVKVDLTKYLEEHIFNFDRAFDETATNQQIYLETIRPLVESAFQGAKVTCFAYGQTGSGKTFTMMGESGGDSKENYYTIPGLYLLAAQDVFTLLEQPCFQHLQVYISFYEIYCTKLHDLLNDRQQLFAREDGKQKVNIVGLSEKRVLNTHSLMQIIDFGNSVRTTSSTGANDDSSRSHAILQITLKNGNKVHGKMSFIDLAGSERGADVTDTNKQTRMDGAEINKSLLALKECIRALDLDKKHTPFRGSKLTLVLKDSFTGNCKTVMIGNISPATSACEHTLNTLRYADRVKELKKPNAEPSAPLSQADLLAQQLMLPRQTKNTVKIAPPSDDDPTPMPNPYPHPQTMSAPNNQNNKNSKARFSMPVYPGNQGQYDNNKLFPQNNNNNYYQNQMVYNNNNMYQPNADNLWNQDNSYQQQYNQESNLRDILNIPPQKDNQSLLSKNKGMQMQMQNNYQPNLYQNSVPLITDQPKQPYNFSAQINLGKKKPMQGNEDYGSEASTASKMQGFKPAPSVNSRNSNAMEMDLGRMGIEENKYKGEELLNQINKKHEELINVILAEEEEVISLHRQHIDDMVDLIKQEMGLLNEVDKPASDIDEYVESLDAVLAHKLETITLLKSKLVRFKEHLKEEEALNKKFNEQKNEMMDIFDLGVGSDDKDDMQLLDNLHQVV